MMSPALFITALMQATTIKQLRLRRESIAGCVVCVEHDIKGVIDASEFPDAAYVHKHRAAGITFRKRGLLSFVTVLDGIKSLQ